MKNDSLILAVITSVNKLNVHQLNTAGKLNYNKTRSEVHKQLWD